MAWIYFALIQLVSAVASVVGWIALIPFCLTQAWVRDAKSIKDGRDIDRWKWRAMNAVFGNPEDGVSGQTALVTVNDQQAPYMPDAWAPWRAYCWSGLRNSCDNLKYIFAWSKGPLIEKHIFGRRIKLGWQNENGKKVPVFSVR